VFQSSGKVVGIVKRLYAGRPRNRGSIAAKSGKYSDRFEAHKTLYSIRTWHPFPRGKAADIRSVLFTPYSSAVRNEWSFNSTSEAVPWLRRLVAGLSSQRPGFDPKSVHVRFVVDKVALGQGFLPVLRFSAVSFIPLVLQYTEKRKKNALSSSQGCTISLQAAVRA
jgi:hypothetical protein